MQVEMVQADRADKAVAIMDSPGAARVLVVDDSRMVRMMVRGYLRNAGFHVDEAADGASAFEMVQSGAYDVVVSDLRMPGMDGFALLEAIQGCAGGPEVILLTGTHARDVDAAVRALRLGAHDYLSKPPAGPQTVVLAVERALEKKQLRDTNRRLMRELEALSRTDGLTGVLNRRAFNTQLEDEVARARRYGLPLSVVLLDIDHFKLVNDTHGHPAGDAILQGFAALAASMLRETDLLYRYGGEEFVILLPHTPVEGAQDTAARIVNLLAKTPLSIGSKSLSVTCSAGVAEIDAKETQGVGLVARADAALYEAKANGRNQVRGGRSWLSQPPSLAIVPAAPRPMLAA